MTQHYFENKLVNLHYYKYGGGPKIMLCFHGYGMHGKQFKVLETTLGDQYTLYGFDLFFHKETKLKNQELSAVEMGITKKDFATLILEFCKFESINRFSVIGYSMGTHYATVVTEQLGELVDEYIVAAPSCLHPGVLLKFFSKYKIGNSIIKQLALNSNALFSFLKFLRKLNIIDQEAYQILFNEIGTPELRFNCYACFVYLRFFETDKKQLKGVLNQKNIKSVFIFGKRDKAYPPKYGLRFINNLKNAQLIILDEGHEMIKKSFVQQLTNVLK